MYDESYLEPSPLANRIGIGTIVLLAAAFLLSSMSVFSTSTASADLSGNRDDDVREVSYKDDNDDDDDTGNNGNSRSGSPSIGSRSANTATGTTRGTGVSRTVSNSSGQSNNTQTGTTRGTGPSANSVSNSS